MHANPIRFRIAARRALCHAMGRQVVQQIAHVLGHFAALGVHLLNPQNPVHSGTRQLEARFARSALNVDGLTQK